MKKLSVGLEGKSDIIIPSHLLIIYLNIRSLAKSAKIYLYIALKQRKDNIVHFLVSGSNAGEMQKCSVEFKNIFAEFWVSKL